MVSADSIKKQEEHKEQIIDFMNFGRHNYN